MKSLNPLSLLLDTYRLSGVNYLDWIRNLKLVLTTEKLVYVLDTPRPLALNDDSTEEERAEFNKWVVGDIKEKST